jgi:Dolichyl-phosphate-mannose-protein mannosyltransferase
MKSPAQSNTQHLTEIACDNRLSRQAGWYRRLWELRHIEIGLCLIPIVLFIGLRLPMLTHQPGGQDEQFFAVPGLTVLREGIPRIPYLPTRKRETLFENADRCLMSLPPAFFYLQAPFFAMLPAGYPTARAPSMFGACLMLVLVFALARNLGAGVVGALVASLLLALSRPLMFCGIIARPDLWCVLCGLAVFYTLFTSTTWHPALMLRVGLMCGLGALFHPFALVFGIQAAVATWWTPGGWRSRLASLFALSCGALAALALWLPLIFAYPYEFRTQFFSNVLDRAGPGLPSRMIWPLDSLRHHVTLLNEFAGLWQCGLLLVGLVCGLGLWWPKRGYGHLFGRAAWIWSSVYLTAVVAGLHPTKGYWLYPMALSFVCIGVAVDRLLASNRSKLLATACGLATLLPGAGLKSTWTYLRHFRSPDYHGDKFIQNVLADLP